ncbi:unnamed protein product, partial [Meganyctiphanes norvegica]
SINSSDNKVDIVTSTPYTTPVTSPDRQACLDSGTRHKSQEIFKTLEKGVKSDSRTGAASQLVDQAKGEVISPIRNSEKPLAGSNSCSSDSESDLSHSGNKELVFTNMAPKVDDIAAQKLADRLGNMSSSAEADVEKAKAMYDAREHTETAVMKGILKRLENWNERLEKIEKEFIGYKGTLVDVSAVIGHSEDTRMDLVEQKVILESYIQGIESAAVKSVASNSTKIVKTSASHFPEFDGESDYEIWGSIWKSLADNSGLSEAGLLIKLRESIVGRAKNYIGESGMANLSYAQVWDKLKERYAVPWARTQQAT